MKRFMVKSFSDNSFLDEESLLRSTYFLIIFSIGDCGLQGLLDQFGGLRGIRLTVVIATTANTLIRRATSRAWTGYHAYCDGNFSISSFFNPGRCLGGMPPWG